MYGIYRIEYKGAKKVLRENASECVWKRAWGRQQMVAFLVIMIFYGHNLNKIICVFAYRSWIFELYLV